MQPDAFVIGVERAVDNVNFSIAWALCGLTTLLLYNSFAVNSVADRLLIRPLNVLWTGVKVVLLKVLLVPRPVMTASILVSRPGFTIVTWRPG